MNCRGEGLGGRRLTLVVLNAEIASVSCIGGGVNGRENLLINFNSFRSKINVVQALEPRNLMFYQ